MPSTIWESPFNYLVLNRCTGFGQEGLYFFTTPTPPGFVKTNFSSNTLIFSSFPLGNGWTENTYFFERVVSLFFPCGIGCSSSSWHHMIYACTVLLSQYSGNTAAISHNNPTSAFRKCLSAGKAICWCCWSSYLSQNE